MYAAAAAAFLLAGWVPDVRPWGLHALAFLPRAVWGLALVVLAAGAAPAVAARVADAAAWWARVHLAHRGRLVGAALVAGTIFYALRLEFQFLGDGAVWLEQVQNRVRFFNFEPLAATLVRWVAEPRADARAAAAWPSIACGPLYLITVAFLVRALWAEAPARGVAAWLLVANPLLLLFFGYVESYPLLVPLQAMLLLALVASARGRVPALVPVLLAAAAVAMHLQAVAWLPALIALARARAGGWRRAAARGTAWSLGALGVAALVVMAVGVRPGYTLARLAGEAGLGSVRLGWVFSGAHALDVAGQASLVLLGPLVLVAAARPGAARGAWLPVAWMLPGPLLVWALVPPRIGAARDWDLYLPVVLPACLLAVNAWWRWAPAAAAARVAAGRALVLATVTAAAWLAVQLDAPRAAARMHVLQDRRGTFGALARGYANETLGMYLRERDPRRARDAYARAVEANPVNGRYHANLAQAELLLGRIEPARDAFAAAAAHGMRVWHVLYNQGLCELQLGRPEAAEGVFDTLLVAFPERWQAAAGRGQARLDQGRPGPALADLDAVLAANPSAVEAHYLRGLALRDLGRRDAARAALRQALRLDPRHEAARRALARLDAAP